MIEELARLPVEVELASEFRYRDPLVGPRTLVLAISQSGETADTLAAVKEAKKRGARASPSATSLGSAIPRESLGTLYTHAGPEIGVASTKAFTTQLAALFLLAVKLGRLRGTLSASRGPASTSRPWCGSRSRWSTCCGRSPPSSRWRSAARRRATSSSWGAAPVPGRARGRAQAEGDLLHPRRGLRGRRDEARPHRAHRREPPGGGARGEGAELREDARQHGGGAGARRAGHRGRRRGRHPRGRAGRGGARRPARARRCSRRSSPSCRSSSSPTTWPT